MALNSSKNARSFDKSIHISDFASHTSTTHSREHIDKHAALRAARDYGLKASQRNRTPKHHRASNSGTQRKISGSAPRAIKEESCIRKESLHDEKQRRNLGPPQQQQQQQQDCTSIEQLERKERHTRHIAMSRVLNWVQESSKLSIADGTLLAHPTDSSEREEALTRDLERESSDQLELSRNLRQHKPIFNAGIQTESSDKQNSERSSRKIDTSRKDSLATVRKKKGVYQNRSREFKEEMDEEEEEGSVEEHADAILVKKRLKELKDAKNSLLAERRVLRLRIEEVQLRREVRQLARDVAKARAELASIALREHREIQNASIEDRPFTRETPIHNSQDTAEQKISNTNSVPPTKHSQINSDNVGPFQSQNPEHKDHQPNFKGTDDQEGITSKSEDEACDDLGENRDLDQEEKEVFSSKVDSVIVKESPLLRTEKLSIETGTEATKCDVRTDADIESARCQSIDNNKAEDTTTAITKLSPAPQEQGSSDHSSNCDEQFLVLEGVSSHQGDVKLKAPTLDNALETKGSLKEDDRNKVIPESTEELATCTIHELEAYVFKNKGLKSAPAGLLQFLQDNDYDSFVKASSYDGVEMLSAGEEQGDIELKETFSEVVKRLAGGRLDLRKAESSKEDNEDLLATRTSSTFSASSEYEANISMLPNEAPEAPTSSETSTPSDEEEDFVEVEDEQLVECNIEEAHELEGQTGRNRDQRSEVFLQLEPFLGKRFQEEPQLKSPEAVNRQRESAAVFVPSPRNTRSSPRSPSRLSATELDRKRGQEASESSKSGPSDTTGSKTTLSVHEGLISASSSSSCWVQFSQTDAAYIEALVGRFIRAFSDPVLPEYLHLDELPLPLTEFCRIEKELGTSYVQEAFDRAVFDSVNQRLMDIYRCCGRVKKDEECPSLAEELWELPSIAYLMEDSQKTVMKTTDCNADPFAVSTCKDHLIDSLLQQDAKRFGKTFPF